MTPNTQPVNSDETPVNLFPVSIDLNATEFEANGTIYQIDREPKLSLLRERYLERYSLYAMLGREPGEIITQIREAYASNNASKHGDVAVRLDNLLKGVIDIEKKAGPAVWICTLFMNRVDEDRKTYDEAAAQRKIDDWQAAGIESRFFLGAGLAWLRATANDKLYLTQNYSALGIVDRPDLQHPAQLSSDN